MYAECKCMLKLFRCKCIIVVTLQLLEIKETRSNVRGVQPKFHQANKLTFKTEILHQGKISLKTLKQLKIMENEEDIKRYFRVLKCQLIDFIDRRRI